MRDAIFLTSKIGLVSRRYWWDDARQMNEMNFDVAGSHLSRIIYRVISDGVIPVE